MDPSRGQHQKIMENSSLETMAVNSKGHQKPKPQPEQALKCPRCDSTNTKFCYYNNYSLSQPRYFCKSCKRYWTKGGTLRNVPVGGGCRKNKRSSSSKRTQDQTLTPSTNPLIINTHHIPPLSSYDHNHIDTNYDLTSAFNSLQKQFDHHHDGDHHLSILGNYPGLNPPFFGNQNNIQSFCNYGLGNESFGEVDNGGVGFNGENMIIPYNNETMTTTTTTTTTTSDVIATTMKHDLDHVRDSTENRLLWGLPWQLIADHHGTNNNNMMGVDFDSMRDNWQGLLNSPLM